MNSDNGNEQFGGKVQEQSDAMQKARTYPGRFGNDENRSPNDAQRQAEIDRVKGC